VASEVYLTVCSLTISQLNSDSGNGSICFLTMTTVAVLILMILAVHTKFITIFIKSRVLMKTLIYFGIDDHDDDNVELGPALLASKLSSAFNPTLKMNPTLSQKPLDTRLSSRSLHCDVISHWIEMLLHNLFLVKSTCVER